MLCRVVAKNEGQGIFDLTHRALMVPSRSNRRVTAQTLRQMATLSVSTPSAGDTGGRSGVRERELDTGTTTTSSSSIPASISSTETTTAGRCLPGSPARAAPRLTSQRSPRRGSGKAVG